MEIKTAVILASGLGTRLKPLTNKIPKPLIEIKGRPLITYTLDNLAEAHITKAIITTRPFKKQFQQKLGTRYKNITITYKHLPTEPILGTAGDLKTVEERLPTNTPFLVCNSDIITNLNFKKITETHPKNKKAATIALIKKKNYPQSIGIGKTGRISKLVRNRYQESKKTYTFAGQHILLREFLEYIPENKFWGFFGDNDLYPNLIGNGVQINPFIYPQETYWEDLGTPQRLKNAKRTLPQNL
ncbi:MAG: nucleotidyltransferase family protein [Patescibacteria group bacterium]